MYKIKILKTAKDDLQDISNYISLDNPLQAKIIIEKIYLSITYLQSFPYLWKERKDWLREIVAKYKYRVFYKIKNTTIYIVSIFKYKDAF